VGEYTGRELTVQGDAVDVVRGLFGMLRRRGVWHVWGVPVRRRKGNARVEFALVGVAR
jgi:hypothetical protein